MVFIEGLPAPTRIPGPLFSTSDLSFPDISSQEIEFERMHWGFYSDGITLSVFELIYVVSILFGITSTRKHWKIYCCCHCDHFIDSPSDFRVSCASTKEYPKNCRKECHWLFLEENTPKGFKVYRPVVFFLGRLPCLNGLIKSNDSRNPGIIHHMTLFPFPISHQPNNQIRTKANVLVWFFLVAP